MPTFDFLHIDADINNDGKINGKEDGILGDLL